MELKSGAPVNGVRPALTQAVLLWPYAVVPALLILVWLDSGSQSFLLRDNLPVSPSEVAWYGILFGFPHIAGSFMSMADKQYIGYYQKELTVIVPISFALAALMTFWLSMPVALLLFNVVTAYHTVGQQAGLARAFLDSSGKAYDRWRSSVNLLACLLPIELLVAFGAIGGAAAICVHAMVLILAFLSTSMAAWLWWRQPQKKSSAHLLMTQVLLLTCVGFIIEGYYFFVLLAPQIVHDITAFTIYATHDRNRLVERPGQNWFYALFGARRQHVLWLLLLTSVGLSYVITSERLKLLALCLSFVHYFFEAPAWRRGSIHRQHLAFSR